MLPPAPATTIKYHSPNACNLCHLDRSLGWTVKTLMKWQSGLDISPVHEGKEGDRITVDTSSERNRYRLVGKVLGEPPFSGVVVHRGWKTAKLALPRSTRAVDPSSPNTITPVEVEVR